MTATTIPPTSAVIGLGLIGNAWAANLNRDNVLAACWNRTPKTEMPHFERDLTVIPSRASILHLVVADETVTRSVVDTLLPYLRPHHLIIQSATIDPKTSTELLRSVRSTGAAYLEAPFTGSLPAAEQRKTLFFLGGEKNDIARATSYFSHISEKQFHIGTNVQACYLKLVMNLQIVSALQALSEALSIARAAGISDELFYDVFRLNASFSGVAALKEQKIKCSEFSPQFSVKHTAKDMRLLDTSLKSSSPLLRVVRDSLALACNNNLGEEDISAIIKVIAPNLSLK